MKKLLTGLLASLLLANSLPALADHRGHQRYYYYGPPVEHHHHHPHRGAPLAWMLGGIALGSALITIAPPPRPVIVAPPVVVTPPVVVAPPPPPARIAWFCQSYQAYYPNVAYCPEGWQPVPVY